MPKAKSGNFTLRRIVAAIPAHQAAHRFAALQRSGRFSELRFVQRGKSAFDIVGYAWPDKGIRRRLGIGRARQNPDQFKVGDIVSLRVLDIDKRPHWIEAQVKSTIGHDAKGRAVYRCEYEFAGQLHNEVCFASDVQPIEFPRLAAGVFNPAGRGGLFTKEQLEQLRREYGKVETFDVSRLSQFRRLLGAMGTAALIQLQNAHIKFLSKLALNELARRAGGVNPKGKGLGPTPNQVLFGIRGKTLVGWINRETPTKYYLTYKVGERIRHVWRPKNAVKFEGTGKYGKLPGRRNICPKTATESNVNPSPELADAVRLSKKFNGFVPRGVKRINVDWPKASMLIGPAVRLDYFSKKWDHKGKVYFHEFEGPCQVFAAARPQSDGTNLLILKGKFQLRPEGITG